MKPYVQSPYMNILKTIIVALVSLLVVIQFFRPARNTQKELLDTDITRFTIVPENVAKILRNSCFDCHSNNTNYPWYINLQPAAWFMDNHIRKGKHHLNFSEFGNYPAKKQFRKIQEIKQEVEEGEMPLSSYTLIHWDAKLGPAEKQLIINWADNLEGKIDSTGILRRSFQEDKH